jgi:peptidoglycan/LPS O-acetylase OafA/YrhL
MEISVKDTQQERVKGSSSTFGERPAVSKFYRPELDVVRFAAFLLVFLFHNLPRAPTPRIDGLLRGFAPVFYASVNACIFGVSLFFTLSAFLICELLVRERETAGTIAVKQFYIRRILRIWPLYYFGLLLGAIFAFTPLGNRSDLINMGWFVIFMGAWQSAIHGWLNNPMFVLWSVSVEEQFYLFAPWMLKWFSRKSLFGLCLAIILSSNVWVYHLGTEHAIGDRIWADSLVQLQCFAAGILLCLILRGQIPRIATWQRLLLLAGSAACWFYACYGPQHSGFGAPSHSPSWPFFGGYVLASVGSVMVLVAFLGMNPRLLPRWAVYLGRISFGLYVFHALAHELVFDALQPMTFYRFPMFLLKTCGTFGLTVLMAALSYRYLETPFLRMKRRHAIIESRPV